LEAFRDVWCNLEICRGETGLGEYALPTTIGDLLHPALPSLDGVSFPSTDLSSMEYLPLIAGRLMKENRSFSPAVWFAA
jgi:hypothetical protein